MIDRIKRALVNSDRAAADGGRSVIRGAGIRRRASTLSSNPKLPCLGLKWKVTPVELKPKGLREASVRANRWRPSASESLS